MLVAALELGADGGYEAVQMRDVAASAEVALGTIYRYFPSKDALLAAAMLEWMEDLERRVSQRAPRGETTSERVYDVLRRAVGTMERQPRLAEAVITALTSDDRDAGAASTTTTDVMQRVLIQAFPEGTDPTTKPPSRRCSGTSGSRAWWRGATASATSPGWARSSRPPPTSSATIWVDLTVPSVRLHSRQAEPRSR